MHLREVMRSLISRVGVNLRRFAAGSVWTSRVVRVGIASGGILSGVYVADRLASRGASYLGSHINLFTLHGVGREYVTQCAGMPVRVHVGAFCKSKGENLSGGKPPSAVREASNRPPFCVCDCGEDAFFYTESKDSLSWMGVADGVGGWRDMGIDPALFAWALTENCRVSAETSGGTPKDVLSSAFARLKREGRVKAGSSTACVVKFDREKRMLEYANLGDSGLLVIRGSNRGKGEVVFRTEDQQHFFNAPYQLSVVPKRMATRGNLMDNAEDADEGQVEVEGGDLVIIATDGVFDNLYDEEILREIQETRKKFFSVGDHDKNIQHFAMLVAQRLVARARLLATDDKRISPFARGASKAYRQRVTGGKWDDVTVMCAVVEELDETREGARGG